MSFRNRLEPWHVELAEKALERTSTFAADRQLIDAALSIVARIENNEPAFFHIRVDLGDDRIGQRFGEGQDVQRILVSVPVRKPHRQEFVRTHPDPAMSIEAAILELKHDRQTFIVAPELAPYLPGEAVAKLLMPTLTNHGTLFLWGIKLPDEQGRLGVADARRAGHHDPSHPVRRG